MGRQLTYEIGRVNIGRRIKCFGNVSAFPPGMPATLKGATEKTAEVLPDGHGKTERVEWKYVLDWTSHNTNPLALPPGSATAKLQLPLRMTPVEVAAPPAPAEPVSPFDVYVGLGDKLKRGLGEVAAAEDLVDSALEQLQAARAAHTEAVESLNKLRRDAAGALAAVDALLTGTTAATRPQIAGAACVGPPP